MSLRFLYQLVLMAVVAVAAPAGAQTVEDSIIRQLRAQGFTEFDVSRSWLGRIVIQAENETLEREIVVNPQTGEILRDYWRERGDRSAPRILDLREDDGRDDDRDRSVRDDDRDAPPGRRRPLHLLLPDLPARIKAGAVFTFV